MNAAEVNALLTKAGIIDPRMRRVDPIEAADRAEAWAEILADVNLSDALEAMQSHYADSSDVLMPSHIVEHAGVRPDPWADLPDVTPLVIAESKQRALAAAGVTEEEFEARKTDRAWVVARFGALELEGGGSA